MTLQRQNRAIRLRREAWLFDSRDAIVTSFGSLRELEESDKLLEIWQPLCLSMGGSTSS